MKRIILFMPFLAAAAIIFQGASSGAGAVQQMDRTGGPLASGYCGNGGCHGGGSFGTEVSLALLESGNAITEYEPGESYTLRVTVGTTTAAERYGMMAVALTGANDEGAGTFGSPNSGTQVTPLNGRDYFEHSGKSTSEVFEIEWTAPEAGTGDVRFYAAGNAVNNNGSTGGDEADFLENPVVITEATATSTRDIPGLEQLTTFPNPASDHVMVDARVSEPGTYRLLLLDAAGRNLSERSWQLRPGANRQRVELHGLPEGMYYLQMTDGRAVHTLPVAHY